MKYYGERTKRLYETVEECERAEFEAKEKENLAKIEKERKERELKEKKEKDAAERKVAAEKVEAARKAYIEAQHAYKSELESFCKAYGSYHYTATSADEVPSLFDWFDGFFRF